MNIDAHVLSSLLTTAAAEGRSSLFEHEVYAFLQAAGCRVPGHVLVPVGQSPDPARIDELGRRSGRLVLKIVSPAIAHKTDVGGVAMVEARPELVADRMRQMVEEVSRRHARYLAEQRAPKLYEGLDGPLLAEAVRKELRGILLVEYLELEGQGPGSEVLFGLRHNREFGPVLTLGAGGVDTELLGGVARKGLAVASGSALLLDEAGFLALLRGTLAYRRLAGLTRASRRLVEDGSILRVIRAFRAIAEHFGPEGKDEDWTLLELEVNPFGVAGGELVALDGLLQFAPKTALPSPRPLRSLGPLLRPRSAGLVGVSAKGMNMGRIILRNLLEAGFDPERTYVVRPGSETLDGVRCVPSVKDLPERVDLFVVAVAAEQVPDLVEELVAHDKAIGVILIPGGMGEKEGGARLETRLRAAIARGRLEGRDLVVTGGNCLGIVSRPGRYHTIFIPKEKLPLRTDGKSTVAFISQSGAYMISRMSKLSWLSPRYAVSTGNQVDLTVGDFLEHLAGDAAVQTFAVYVEGFQDGDGLRFARIVHAITGSGRDVIFYKAGRTSEGKTASSGHTASLAGDYDVCEAILLQAGAHVARTFSDFSDLTRISCLMGQKAWAGRRLAALSNAGFEAVGIADSLRGEGWHLELAGLSAQTRAAIARALAKEHLDALVDARNPLDLTPMASDAPHEEAVRAFLDDPGVDLVLCATVPLTSTMATLAEGVSEEQTIRSPGSLVNRLPGLVEQTQKPLVASVDSGALYDPLCRALEEAGIPTFRSADDAVRVMGLYLEGRLRRRLRPDFLKPRPR